MRVTLDVELLIEPRDLWVGAYWRLQSRRRDTRLRVYVCLVPCLPLVITVTSQASC
jgi:hypothetical protein